MNAIIDQQRTKRCFDFGEAKEVPPPTLIDVIHAIEEQAAYLATSHHHPRTAVLAELIEGLAQAVQKLAEQQQQGWAPVLEEKR